MTVNPRGSSRVHRLVNGCALGRKGIGVVISPDWGMSLARSGVSRLTELPIDKGEQSLPGASARCGSFLTLARGGDGRPGLERAGCPSINWPRVNCALGPTAARDGPFASGGAHISG